MRVSFSIPIPSKKSSVALATVALIFSAGVASAGTMHRFAATVTSGAGAGGATVVLQPSASGSALQGEVSASPDTSLNVPFGMLGEYNTAGTFGVGVAGLSSTGYGVAAETLGTDTNPAMLALNNTGGDGLDAGGTAVGVNAFSAGGTALVAFAPFGVAASFLSNTKTALEVSNFNNAGYTADFGGGGGLNIESGRGADSIDAASDSFGQGGSAIVASSGGYGILGMGNTFGSHPAVGVPGVAGVDTVGGSDLFAGYAYNGGSPTESFIVQASTVNASGETLGAGIGSDV